MIFIGFDINVDQISIFSSFHKITPHMQSCLNSREEKQRFKENGDMIWISRRYFFKSRV